VQSHCPACLHLTEPPVLAFIVIPVALALLLATGASVAAQRGGASPAVARRRGLVTLAAAAAWMTATWTAAQSGILADWDRLPPPFAGLVVSVFALAALVGLSPFGRTLAHHIPLWILVAVQGFRLPLELAMHAMYERGVMPAQMSYSGWNFDIVTGIAAIAVAMLVRTGRAGRRLVFAWNVLGSLLLANIIVIAIASTPAFRAFGDDRVNTWVTDPPFVWLPAVMVLAALAGHVLIFRALWIRN
jgi:hypothetical protein